jgi:hypothetical protein
MMVDYPRPSGGRISDAISSAVQNRAISEFERPAQLQSRHSSSDLVLRGLRNGSSGKRLLDMALHHLDLLAVPHGPRWWFSAPPIGWGAVPPDPNWPRPALCPLKSEVDVPSTSKANGTNPGPRQ